MSEEVIWLQRIFCLMLAFLVLLGVDIALLYKEIDVLKKQLWPKKEDKKND